MNFNHTLHVIIIIEKGVLEQQALLLVKSINKFIAPHTNVNIMIFSPRNKKFHPSGRVIEKLKLMDARYIDKPLNNKHNYFPLCNGIYAASYAEQQAANKDLVLLVDTDTVFLNRLDDDILGFNGVSMRPVDNKGIGSSGKNDENDDFWKNAFDLFGLTPTQNRVKTTIGREIIRPYYNSGFVMCPKHIGFFNTWKFCFEKMMDSNIRTDASFSRHQSDFGFLEQMTLSIATEKLGITTQLLPPTYNYPIPFRHRFFNTSRHIPLSELRHIHYHRWFQHPNFLTHVTTDEDRLTEKYQWMKKHLPLYPLIDDAFK